jgi:YVTN family beta-propeller protein
VLKPLGESTVSDRLPIYPDLDARVLPKPPMRDGNRNLCAWVAAVFALTAAGLMGLPMGSSFGAARAGPAQASVTAERSQSPTASMVPAMTNLAAFSVRSTLVLFNNTLVSGNFQAGSGFAPGDAVYDARTGVVFVADQQSDLVSVISDVTDNVVTTIPLNESPSGMAFDSAQGELFVGGASSVSLISDTTDRIVATVPMAAGAMAYDTGRGEMWMVSAGSVKVVTTSTNSVNATISVGAQPTAVAYDSGAGEMFVTNFGNPPGFAGTVSVIKDSTDKVVATVPVGSQPAGIAYDAAKGEVFVTNEMSNNVSVIADSSNTVIANISVGTEPDGIAYDPGTGEMFVANLNLFSPGSVSVISDSTNALVATIPVGFDFEPRGVVYDSGTHEVATTNWDSASVSVISDTSYAVVATVLLGAQPTGLVYDSGRGEIFVANAFLPGTVSVINDTTNLVVTSVTVGPDPSDIVYDHATGEVFVLTDYDLTAISDSSNTVVAVIPACEFADGLAVDSGRAEVFVSCPYTNNVEVISETSDSIVDRVAVGDNPEGLAYDSVRGEVFVTDSWANNVSIISDGTDRVVATVRVGQYPVAAVYDNGAREVAVMNRGSNTTSLVSDTTNRVVATVRLGGSPWAAAYDTAGAEVLFTSSYSDNVAIVSDALRAAGAPVAVGKWPQGATFDSGTGDFYVSNFLGGTVTILGPSSRALPVTFRSVGLPSGSNWSVTYGLPSALVTNQTVSGSGLITFLAPVPAGVLVYSIQPPSGYGIARVTGPLLPSQTRANITGPTTLLVHFGGVETSCFNETSLLGRTLPSGATWGVALKPLYPGGPINQIGSNTTVGSAGSVRFAVPRGAVYRFEISPPSVYRAVPARGSIAVLGHSSTTFVQFLLLTSSVELKETGLGAHTLWGVNVTGPQTLRATSTSPVIVLHLENGSYSYVIWNLTPRYPHPASGSFVVTVPHAPTIITVVYNTTLDPE